MRVRYCCSWDHPQPHRGYGNRCTAGVNRDPAVSRHGQNAMTTERQHPAVLDVRAMCWAVRWHSGQYPSSPLWPCQSGYDPPMDHSDMYTAALSRVPSLLRLQLPSSSVLHEHLGKPVLTMVTSGTVSCFVPAPLTLDTNFGRVLHARSISPNVWLALHSCFGPYISVAAAQLPSKLRRGCRRFVRVPSQNPLSFNQLHCASLTWVSRASVWGCRAACSRPSLSSATSSFVAPAATSSSFSSSFTSCFPSFFFVSSPIYFSSSSSSSLPFPTFLSISSSFVSCTV